MTPLGTCDCQSESEWSSREKIIQGLRRKVEKKQMDAEKTRKTWKKKEDTEQKAE